MYSVQQGGVALSLVATSHCSLKSSLVRDHRGCFRAACHGGSPAYRLGKAGYMLSLAQVDGSYDSGPGNDDIGQVPVCTVHSRAG